MQDKKQQLGLDMEQRTVSNMGKEYFKVVYYHPVCLCVCVCVCVSYSVMSDFL